MIPLWVKRLVYQRGIRPKAGSRFYSPSLAWFYAGPRGLPLVPPEISDMLEAATVAMAARNDAWMRWIESDVESEGDTVTFPLAREEDPDGR